MRYHSGNLTKSNIGLSNVDNTKREYRKALVLIVISVLTVCFSYSILIGY